MAAAGTPTVKLIVAEVVLEWTEPYDPLAVLPRPEGTTFYPDARVFVRTRIGTPRWIPRLAAFPRRNQRGRGHLSKAP